VAPAPRRVGPLPEDLPGEELILQSDSGARLAGWYIPAPSARGVIVLLHGIRSSRHAMVGRARYFRSLGWSILAIDFQSHGESTGGPVTAGFVERLDAQSAVRAARARAGDSPVVVVGQSMGGAAAVLASPLPIDGLVLEQVYSTVASAVDNRVRRWLGPAASPISVMLLWSLRLRLGLTPQALRPLELVDQVGCPLLVLAGTADQHATAEQTQALFSRAREPKQLVWFEGAAHVDLLRRHAPRYQEATRAFLEGIA
jgi:fermentation-respiration switch protein FrsA (DUF1100 family)